MDEPAATARPTGGSGRRRGEALTGATLIAFGLLGVFLPFATGALFVALASESPTGTAWLVFFFRLATTVPGLCIAALVVAAALYARARWSRPAATLVSILMMASVATVSVAAVLQREGSPLLGVTEPDELTVGDVAVAVLYHLSASQPSFVPTAVVVAGFGFAAFVGLRRGRTAAEPPSAQPGQPDAAAARRSRRPNVAMLFLAVIAVVALAPYIGWLLNAVVPGVAQAHDGQPPGGDNGPNATIGLGYAIPSAIASVLSFASFRAIRRRAASGAWLAPGSALIAGPWTGLWLVVLGGSAAIPASSPDGHSTFGLQSLLLFGIAPVAALAVIPVTVSVYRHRDWFVESHGSPAPRASGWPSRAFAVGTGLGLALALPLVIAIAVTTGRPEPLRLSDRTVVFEEASFTYAGPIEAPTERLRVAGGLSAWSSDLHIDEPTVYAFDPTPTTDAIALYGNPYDDGERVVLSIFVPDTARDEIGELRIPRALCPYVKLEAPGVSIQPCGPPSVFYLRGDEYLRVDESGFVVTSADVRPTGATAAPQTIPDERVDLTVLEIRDVNPGEAVALRIGARVVVYRTGIYPSDLCRYSPTATEDPFGLRLAALEAANEPIDGATYDRVAVPFGCGFPAAVWLNDRPYTADRRLLDLLDVPTSVLAPIGIASAIDIGFPEDGVPVEDRWSFPATLDGTAYSIGGVDPATAVAFIVNGMAVVAIAETDDFLVPAQLCSFLRQGALDEPNPERDRIACDGSAP